MCRSGKAGHSGLPQQSRISFPKASRCFAPLKVSNFDASWTIGMYNLKSLIAVNLPNLALGRWWERALAGQHEDLSLNPHNPHKNWAWLLVSITGGLGRDKQS